MGVKRSMLTLRLWARSSRRSALPTSVIRHAVPCASRIYPVSLSTFLFGFMLVFLFVSQFSKLIRRPGYFGVSESPDSFLPMHYPRAVRLLAIGLGEGIRHGYTSSRSSELRSTDIQSWLGLATYPPPSLLIAKKSVFV